MNVKLKFRLPIGALAITFLFVALPIGSCAPPNEEDETSWVVEEPLVADVSVGDHEAGAREDATAPQDTGRDTDNSAPAPVRTPGQDHTCNDDPGASAYWGSCNDEGNCTCHESYEKNPETGRCRPADSIDVITGNPCDGPTSCGPDHHCYEDVPAPGEPPGGYCLPGAPTVIKPCRIEDDDCPTGTRCSPIPWSAISGVCMRACQDHTDCREDYECLIVELFPGQEDSPTSAGLVCWYRTDES